MVGRRRPFRQHEVEELQVQHRSSRRSYSRSSGAHGKPDPLVKVGVADSRNQSLPAVTFSH